MAKLNAKEFETLQDGLDALMEREQSEDSKENKRLLKRIKDAEDALVAVGTY
jgi:hypothetical protein